MFRAECLKCHDADGSGESVRDVMPRLPDFRDPRFQDSKTDDELARSILEGKGKSMRPMREKVGSSDVGDLVLLIRGFRGGRQVISDDTTEPIAASPPADDPAEPQA